MNPLPRHSLQTQHTGDMSRAGSESQRPSPSTSHPAFLAIRRNTTNNLWHIRSNRAILPLGRRSRSYTNHSGFQLRVAAVLSNPCSVCVGSENIFAQPSQLLTCGRSLIGVVGFVISRSISQGPHHFGLIFLLFFWYICLFLFSYRVEHAFCCNLCQGQIIASWKVAFREDVKLGCDVMMTSSDHRFPPFSLLDLATGPFRKPP